MKALALIIVTSVAANSAVLAQSTTARGDASAQSQTSVSADRSGANVASENRAQGSVAAQRNANEANEGSSGQQAGAAGNFAGASEMNATLDRPVDARRAKTGDEVTATTNESYQTASGVTIPRGTRLVGHVTQARAHARGEGEAAAASQLGIVFDRAVLKDGREVPMQASIQALAAARSEAQGEFGSASHDVGGGAFGAARATGGGAAGGGLGGGRLGGGLAGGVTGGATSTIGGATRLPGPAVGGAVGAAGQAAALGSSAGAVGGLDASGQWLAGSRGAFGFGDFGIASAAAGSAQGSLITSASRNVRLDSGTQLLLIGSAAAGR